MSLMQVVDIILNRQRRTFAAVALAAFIAAAIVTFALPRVYEAKATLFVGENRAISAGANAVQLDEVLASTYAELLGSSQIERQVARALPFPASPEEVDQKVSFQVVSGTRLIEIQAADRSPRRAQILANTDANVFVRAQQETAANAQGARLAELDARIRDLADRTRRLQGSTASGELAQLQTQLDAARSAYRTTQENIALQGSNVTVASPASAPLDPARPRPKLYLAVGALIALILGALAALLRDVFDKRVRDEDELEEIMEAPLLARVPVAAKSGTRTQPFDEAFQFLRENLRRNDLGQPPQVVAVTSALPGDGKSTVVMNLSRAVALSGSAVVAVDCDLRKPALAGYFGVDAREGVTNVLVRTRETSDVLTRTQIPGARIIPSGPVPPNPSVLLGLPRFGEMLDELRAEGDFVVVDTPPATTGAETSTVGAAVDGVILVVDLQRSRRDALRATKEQLAKAHTRVLGLVVNRVSERGVGYGYYGAYRQDENAPAALNGRGRERVSA